jgi:hypothetical protein
MSDLLWADPEKDLTGRSWPKAVNDLDFISFSFTGWGPNDRGVSYTFGADSKLYFLRNYRGFQSFATPKVVFQFLRKHDMDLVVRAHQVRDIFINLSNLLLSFYSHQFIISLLPFSNVLSNLGKFIFLKVLHYFLTSKRIHTCYEMLQQLPLKFIGH